MKLPPVSEDLVKYRPQWAEGIVDDPTWTEKQRGDEQEAVHIRNALRNDECVINYNGLFSHVVGLYDGAGQPLLP